MGLGYLLGSKGVLTEQFTGDPAIRNRQEIEGRPPGSLLLGGKFRKFTGNPIGDTMVMGATIFQRDFGKLLFDANETGDFTEVAKSSLGLAIDLPLGIAGDLPLAEGVSRLVELGQDVSRARTNDDRFKAFAAFGGKAIGNFVPSASAGVATQLDPQKRRVRPNRTDSIFDVATAPIKARLPILREDLPLDKSVAGRAVS